MSFSLSDLERRLSNLLRIGTIAALDEANARVRVAFGEITTDWLPWLTRRASEDRDWWAPEPGEQVLVLSPSGELAQGVVLPAINSDANPPPAAVKTKRREQFADGAFIEYDRAANAWHLDVPAAGSITLHIGATTLLLENSKATLTTPDLLVDSPLSTFTGAVLVQGLLTYAAGMIGSGGSGATATITGNVQFAGGDLTHNGKDIGSTHTHSGVDPGSGTSGPPS